MPVLQGFWGDEGEYISLNNKHNFQASHLGCMMGMLRERLQVRRRTFGSQAVWQGSEWQGHGGLRPRSLWVPEKGARWLDHHEGLHA